MAASLVAATALVLALTAVAGAEARPAEPGAPVVVDDTVEVWPGGTTTVDVLANDSDPGGDDLALCRLPAPLSPGPVRVSDDSMMSGTAEPGPVTVSVRDRARGSHVIDYYVCNHRYLSPARLTVVIRQVRPVHVTAVSSRPGTIRVRNHNDQRVFLVVTDRGGCKLDASGRVPAHGTRTFRVRHHHIRWTALIGRSTDTGVAGSGRVRNVVLDGPPAAATKPGNNCFYDFAWLRAQSG